MKKKKIIAFWDLLIVLLFETICFAVHIWFVFYMLLDDQNVTFDNLVICTLFFCVPPIFFVCLHRMYIEGDEIRFRYFPVIDKHFCNDCIRNWDIVLSEVEK